MNTKYKDLKTIWYKSNKNAFEELRAELLAGRACVVESQYETCYGIGFEHVIDKAIEDIPHTTEPIGYYTASSLFGAEMDIAGTFLVSPVKE